MESEDEITRLRGLPDQAARQTVQRHPRRRNQIAMSDNQILAVYVSMEESEPDISTERLLAMCADACKCTVEEVVNALIE